MTYQLNHIDPDEIDSLRLKAFKTNDPADTLAYYRAASAYSQDRHVREMNRAEVMRCAECDCEKGGADCNWIATPTPAMCCLGLTPEQCAHTPSSQCEGLRPAVDPMDDPRVTALVGLLKEARDDIEAYVDADWPENLRAQYPSYLSKWERDMELCRRIDAVLSALEENK